MNLLLNPLHFGYPIKKSKITRRRMQPGFALGGRLVGQGQRVMLALLCGFALGFISARAAETNSVPAILRYEIYSTHDPNGTGKFYLGREIADVMGHQAADWLERPERQTEERTDLLVPLLRLKPGDTVADIGAGTGYYTRLLATAVGTNLVAGTSGLVYAEDIQPEMLEILTNKMAAVGLHNVRSVLGTISDPKLPSESLDLILMVDVYHEFDHPFEMVEAMCRSLKPGGRMVFVEFRGEDPKVPIKLVHKMTVAQVRKEMAVQPLEWMETIEKLPQQHVIIFRKQIARVTD